MHREICDAVATVMRVGGYLDRLQAAGPELDRVKAFALALAGEREPEPHPPGQGAWLLPPFPGLASRPIHASEDSGATEVLVSHWRAIRDEAACVDPRDFIAYSTKTTGAAGEWSVLPFVYMGTAMPDLCTQAPMIWDLLCSLPRACLDYPWGDAVLSRHQPGAHLPPHSSVDNLRLRCHLGLNTQPGAAIRVHDHVHSWRDGEIFLFEDAYEHEAWNRGEADRLILIVDLWHPSLTEVETRALSAGFRKSEVREVFFDLRLKGEAERYRDALRERFQAEDDDPLLREFWSR